MSSNSPYNVVSGPDYGSGLVNWSQLGQMGQQGNPKTTPAQAQAGAGAGAPGGVMTPAQAQNGAGAPNTTMPPSQAQNQMQGLGQRLMMMFGLGGPGGQGGGAGGNMSPSIGNPTSLAPQQPAPQPAAHVNPASPYGLF